MSNHMQLQWHSSSMLIYFKDLTAKVNHGVRQIYTELCLQKASDCRTAKKLFSTLLP